MFDREMNEEFKLRGVWWRPGDTSQIAGELHHSEGHIELRIDGTFEGTDIRSEFPVLHGFLDDGRSATLLKSFPIRRRKFVASITPSGAARSEMALACNCLLVGMHLEGADDEAFDSLQLKVRHFTTWVGDRPFETELTDIDQATVRYSGAATRDFELPQDLGKLSIISAFQPPSSDDHKVIMHHEALLTLSPSASHSVEWMVKKAHMLEALLSVLFGHVTQIERLRIHAPAAGLWPYADVFLPRHWISNADINFWELLTRFSDVEAFLPTILKSWFTMSDLLDVATGLVLMALRRPGDVLETRFMPMAQAIEVFSRATDLESVHVSKVVYRGLRKHLKRAFPRGIEPTLRDSMLRSLGFANEFSLRDRVRRLVNSVDADTRELFCKDPERFVAGVVATRNYYTHYGSRGNEVLDGLPLHYATQKLQHMMRILLLIHLGVPEDKVRTLWKKNYRFGNLSKGWRKYREAGNDPDDPGA